MADSTITALAEDTAPASADWLVSVDVDDTTMSANGTDKKVKVSSLATLISSLIGPAFDAAGAAAAALASAVASSLQRSSNLSDLGNAATARTNLGLGTAAIQASTAFAPAAGSTSITTLGTVATGAWQGSVIAAAYLPAMGASGAGHAAGLVPDPGSTAGTTHYLREDGTWAVPAGGGGAMSIGGAVTGGTAGSVLFVGASGLAQDNADLFYDAANKRLGIGTATPQDALDVEGGRITGGRNAAFFRNYLDMSSSAASSIPAVDFAFPSGTIFRVAEVGILGVKDCFFQALPASGYGYLETYGGSGMAIGTGTGVPVLIRPNRNTTAQFTAAGSAVLGAGSVATTATDGFVYIPKCLGTPTGTPTAFSGLAPVVVDDTGNYLWVYTSAGWKKAALT